ncbi:MAG TPA: ParB N-terminal domain-containing protein [Burkholderiales bacterium]|nr:ParB N-terminal domain-containing protein [Burkholderiales bacterium]
MHEPAAADLRTVEISALGERLSALRLCEPASLAAVRLSLQQHGQLTALTLFAPKTGLEIIDGFKRVRAARDLGWPTLQARVDDVDAVNAKLLLRALHDRRGLTEIEEAWLVRSLFRDDLLSQPQIARCLRRDKSWVWRRIMLVEALDPIVQIDVRLGLLAPRAAVAISRLPRGNQQSASAVVVRRGLTVRQTELLVEEVIHRPDAVARTAWLAARLEGLAPENRPGPRATRAVRNEADWMAADILRVRDIAARLSARLGATPLQTFAPAATELLRDALLHLSPVLRALDTVIATATRPEET